MQPQPILALKKRQKQWLGQFPHMPVVVNQYETKLNDKLKYFRIFEIRTEPEVEKDSNDVFRAAMRQLPESIKKSLGVDYFGKRTYTIWYLAKDELSKEQMDSLKAKPPTYSIEMDEELTYKVMLRFVKQSKTNDKESMALITQFLNIRLKQLVVTKCKMKELCRNTFFPPWESYFRDNKFQIETRIGFRFNLEFLEIQLFCDVNNRLRQMNKKTFLEVLRQKREKVGFYIGKRVMKNYGDQRTFVIENIVLDKGPMTKFLKKDQEITYVQYFKKFYQKQITDMHQPLIETSSSVDYKIKKLGKHIQGWKQKIFLVPELVSLAQIPQAAKKALRKQLLMSPNECLSTASDFIKQVNKNQNEFQIFSQNRRGYAHLLPDPSITLNTFTNLTPKEGAFRIESEIYEPIELVDVMVVYSVGKNNKAYDRGMIDEAIKILNKSGERFKIKIKEHFCIEVQEGGSPEDWIAEVEKDLKENSKPSFVLFALLDNQQQLYPLLKNQLTYVLELDSQMFLRSKVSHQQKGFLKIAGNIMKQVAAKKNQTLWKMRPISKYQEKLTLIVGISIQRIGDCFQLVICRSVNKDITKFKTTTYQIASRQIPQLLLQKEFYSMMEDYIKNEKKKFKPTTIVVYRMGLNNEKFVQEHLDAEYGMLYDRVEYICKNKLKQGYFPELIYVQVTDKPSLKIWIEQGGNQPNSFLPRVCNPQVGTVMRGQSDQQFFMVPYKAREGTVQPSFYRVYKNESKVPLQYIIQFTYSQAYMYYNWEGSIRLPQVLQLCKKVHRFVKPKAGEGKCFVFETSVFI